MKRQLLTIAALVAAFVATGCSEADITETVGAEKKSQIEITVATDEENTSRSQITADGKMTWHADDCLFLAYRLQDAAKGYVTSGAASDKAVINGTRASFSAKLEDPSAYTCNEMVYGGIIPACAVKQPCTDAAQTIVTVPAAQTATAGDIDHNADIIIMEPYKTTDIKTTQIAGTFRHIVAINKLVLTGLTAGETIKSVTVTAEGKALAGDLTVDLTTGEKKVGTTTQSAITVTYSDEAAVNAEGTFVVWFTSLDAEIKEGEQLSVDVVTSACTYSKTVTARPEGILFKEAYIYTTTISMENCQKYEVVGTYEIAAKGEIGSRALFPAEYDVAAVAKALGLETETINFDQIQFKGVVDGKFVALVGDPHYICFNDGGTKVVGELDAESRIFVDYYDNGPLRIRPTGSCTDEKTYTCSVALVCNGKAAVFNISMEAKKPAKVEIVKEYSPEAVTGLIGSRDLAKVTYDPATIATDLGMTDGYKLENIKLGYINANKEFVAPKDDPHYICFNDGGTEVVSEGSDQSRIFVDHYTGGTMGVRPTGSCTEAKQYTCDVALVYNDKAVVFHIKMVAKKPVVLDAEPVETITKDVTIGNQQWDNSVVSLTDEDKQKLATALGYNNADEILAKISEKREDSATDEVRYGFVQPDGSISYNYTANGYGFWCKADGYLTNYSEPVNYMYIETEDNTKFSYKYRIGLFAYNGTKFTLATAFVRDSKWVKIQFNITIPEPVVITLDLNKPNGLIEKNVTIATGSIEEPFTDEDKQKVAEGLGLASFNDYVKQITTTGKIRYGLVQPDNTVTYETSAGQHGFWCNAEGSRTNWGGTEHCMFVESINSFEKLHIGVEGNNVEKGKTYIVTTAFVNDSKWVKMVVTINVPAATTTETAQ